MKSSSTKRIAGIGLLILLLATGCRVSPENMERRHWELNDSVRQTNSEQLLLNIVRLRYDEMPCFLQVSSISTQFSARQDVSASGNLTSGSPGVLGLGAGLSYGENPTVTWSLPDSRQYLGRLMAPMSAEQLTALSESGWSPKRVFRVGVKRVNHLRNLEYSPIDGIYSPPSYGDLVEALDLIEELSRAGLVDLAYGVKSNVVAGKIPLDRLDTRAILDGQPYGVQFMPRDDPSVMEVLKLSKPLFLRFAKASDGDDRVVRLRQLLSLADDKYSFGIVDTADSGKEQLLSESGKLSRALDPDVKLDEIVLNNRSIMEVLAFASTYVEVPREHIDLGYTTERAKLKADWLRIVSSAGEPDDAWLKVRYHGRWFFISARDVSSRQSFTLLEAMFLSVVGRVPGAQPLLTIPVN